MPIDELLRKFCDDVHRECGGAVHELTVDSDTFDLLERLVPPTPFSTYIKIHELTFFSSMGDVTIRRSKRTTCMTCGHELQKSK